MLLPVFVRPEVEPVLVGPPLPESVTVVLGPLVAVREDAPVPVGLVVDVDAPSLSESEPEPEPAGRAGTQAKTTNKPE